MYFILEIQGYADGSFAHLVTTAATRLEAEAAYHRVLAAAAVSELPLHSAVVIGVDGTPLLHQCYTHEETQPETDGEA